MRRCKSDHSFANTLLASGPLAFKLQREQAERTATGNGGRPPGNETLTELLKAPGSKLRAKRNNAENRAETSDEHTQATLYGLYGIVRGLP